MKDVRLRVSQGQAPVGTRLFTKGGAQRWERSGCVQVVRLNVRINEDIEEASLANISRSGLMALSHDISSNRPGPRDVYRGGVAQVMSRSLISGQAMCLPSSCTQARVLWTGGGRHPGKWPGYEQRRLSLVRLSFT